MTRETRISVPREDAEWIARSLAEAGMTVLDTGERVTTEAGVNAEAVLCVASFEQQGEHEASMTESLLRR